jgi:hypothetical protein
MEAAVSDDELIELAIEPIEIPHEPAPVQAAPALPPYALVAPRPRSAASTGVTVRDLRAAGLGALLVGALAALVWFGRPPAPRLS